MRLRTNDHLKVLRGSPGRADGFCNLPDYIVFHEEQDSRGGERWLVKAMLAELKSSDASQELAVRQLQLGALLVQYLLSIARFGGQLYSIVELRQCALLISPNLPEPKGRTKRQKTEYEAETLAGVKIPRYDVPCGAKISFDEFEYWSAEI
ncbi:MAG TPA: hypothetical protein VH165_02090 [Kofleriaceae bacterium]|nr:hypothetical protein [Kofleriaceae bacterium]